MGTIRPLNQCLKAYSQWLRVLLSNLKVYGLLLKEVPRIPRSPVSQEIDSDIKPPGPLPTPLRAPPFFGSGEDLGNSLPQLSPHKYPDTSISPASQPTPLPLPVGLSNDPQPFAPAQSRHREAYSLSANYDDTQRHDRRDAISNENWNHTIQQPAHAPLSGPVPAPAPSRRSKPSQAEPEDTAFEIGDSSFISLRNNLGPEEGRSCSSDTWIRHTNVQDYGAPGHGRSPTPHAKRNCEARANEAKADQRPYQSSSSSSPSEASAPPPQRRRMPDGGGQEPAGERQRYIATGRRNVGSDHGHSG